MMGAIPRTKTEWDRCVNRVASWVSCAGDHIMCRPFSELATEAQQPCCVAWVQSASQGQGRISRKSQRSSGEKRPWQNISLVAGKGLNSFLPCCCVFCQIHALMKDSVYVLCISLLGASIQHLTGCICFENYDNKMKNGNKYMHTHSTSTWHKYWTSDWMHMFFENNNKIKNRDNCTCTRSKTKL